MLIEVSNGATTVGHRLVPLKNKHWITIRCGSFMSRQIRKKIEREMQIQSFNHVHGVVHRSEKVGSSSGVSDQSA